MDVCILEVDFTRHTYIYMDVYELDVHMDVYVLAIDVHI